jgi:hypothetical protein
VRVRVVLKSFSAYKGERCGDEPFYLVPHFVECFPGVVV